MNKVFALILTLMGSFSLEALMTRDIDDINREFYDNSGNFFDVIPFEPLLPNLLTKYAKGQTVLEIGSGPGALALWLKTKGFNVTCVEPSVKLAQMAAQKGLEVYPQTIQEFETTQKYDSIVAISSLIHVPKQELHSQIEKMVSYLKPNGHFFVSFIEGNTEGFEDPTSKGKVRFFSRWTESDLDQLLSPYFNLIETHTIRNEKMDRNFILRVYSLKDQ